MAATVSSSETYPCGEITCLCGQTVLPLSLLTSQTFPLTDTITCHCNPCRYVTGTLLPVFACLNAAPPPSKIDKLKAYAFTDRCTRYHCVTCGSMMLVELPKIGKWAVAVGCVDVGLGSEEAAQSRGLPTYASRLMKIRSHGYVNDTIDGGLVPLMLGYGLNGDTKVGSQLPETPTPLFAVGHSGVANALSLDELLRMAQVGKVSLPLPPYDEERLEIKCHCGGVQLGLLRPEPTQIIDSRQSEVATACKYKAWLCGCRACRLSTGSLLQGWVGVLRLAIHDTSDSQPFSLDAVGISSTQIPAQKVKSDLVLYQSSQNMQRGFLSDLWCYGSDVPDES